MSHALDHELPLGEVADILSQQIVGCELSVRSCNALIKSGIRTVGDLIALTEKELQDLPNLGRKSVAEILEFLMGLGLSLSGQAQFLLDISPVSEFEGQSKEEEIVNYQERGLLAPIGVLGLSVRARNGCQALNIRYVGDLVSWTENRLLTTKNVGRKSIQEIQEKLAEQSLALGMILRYWPFEGLEAQAEAMQQQLFVEDDLGLKQNFFTAYDQISDPRSRFVLAARLGIGRDVQTLEEIAGRYQMTRERVRQIQVKLIDKISQKTLLSDRLAYALGKVCADRETPLYLDELGTENAWFQGFEDDIPLLKSLIEAFSVRKAVQFLSVAGREILSPISEDSFLSLQKEFLTMLETNLDTDLTIEDVEDCARMLASAEEAIELTSLLVEAVDHKLTYSVKDGELILAGVGQTLVSHLTVLLAEMPEPLHYKAIADLYRESYDPSVQTRNIHARLTGHPRFLLFDRGVYGGERHLTICAEDQADIIEKTEQILLNGDPKRQWHVQGLLKQLSRQRDVSALNGYKLSLILKKSDQLRYLGKQVWQLKTMENLAEERLHVTQAIYETLVEAGEALSRDEIQHRISKKRGMGEFFHIQETELYGAVAPQKYGLYDRDFVLSLAEQRVMKAYLAEDLNRRGCAYHKSELRKNVMLGQDYVGLTDGMIWGILKADSLFRTWHGGFVGLQAWHVSGRKTVAQAISHVVEEVRTPILSPKLYRAIEVVLGYRFSPNALSVYLNPLGFSYDRATNLWSPPDKAESLPE